jgi:hypothetical protein
MEGDCIGITIWSPMVLTLQGAEIVSIWQLLVKAIVTSEESIGHRCLSIGLASKFTVTLKWLYLFTKD